MEVKEKESTLGAHLNAGELSKLLGDTLTHADTRKDSPRVLGSIQLRAEGGELIAVATDRYRIIEVRVTLGEGAGFPPILVSVADVKRIITLIKETPLLSVELHAVGDLLSVSVGGNSLTARLVGESFPPYEHLFNAGEPTPADSITINPAYMADYAKIIGKGSPIILTPRGQGKPVEIGNLPEGYRALVMPMKIR